MSVLDNAKHEQFAQLVAKGVSATKAYISAGYSANGARAGAARLCAKDTVCARIRQIQETLSAGTIALEISSRNARVQALQNRWDKMRQVIEERAISEEYAHVPGGTTGLLCKDYKGKEADTPVYKVDTGLLAELRNHERQAAEELSQWKTVIEEKKTLDASPAAITLAMALSKEKLDALAAKIKAAKQRRRNGARVGRTSVYNRRVRGRALPPS